MWLLSDRARPVAFPLVLLAVALVLAWWARATADGRIGVLRVLEQPPGTEVVLSLLRVRSIDGPDRFVVGREILAVPVVGPTDGLRVGEEVTVVGVVGDGHVVQLRRTPAPDRPAKRALGVAGLALAAAVVAVGVRKTPEGLVPRG